jgi:hypothetical protein
VFTGILAAGLAYWLLARRGVRAETAEISAEPDAADRGVLAGSAF